MSFLLTLEDDKLDQILSILPKYEKQIASAEGVLKLEGRRLEEVMRTLPHYQASYDEGYQQLKALEEWIKVLKDKKEGKLWKKYTEGYSRALSSRDIQAYIASEKEIVELNQIIIEVALLKSNMLSIVDALKQVGWMMSHITKLRVAELEDAIL